MADLSNILNDTDIKAAVGGLYLEALANNKALGMAEQEIVTPPEGWPELSDDDRAHIMRMARAVWGED
jgi:hypothetical protein